MEDFVFGVEARTRLEKVRVRDWFELFIKFVLLIVLP